MSKANLLIFFDNQNKLDIFIELSLQSDLLNLQDLLKSISTPLCELRQ